jgi:tetratricopeptide (TPR) repeat protein
LQRDRVSAPHGLAARTDAAEIQRRHADHYRELAEQADRPLRRIGHREWLELLQGEAGNLAATVHWYLDNDRAPLPHLFRVLWPFWNLADHMDEARTWADQLLPAADSLDPEARAELVWTALVTALDVGDDAAALAARERLEPLLAGIRDPFLHALSQLATAWSAPLVDDFDGALRGALVSLEELRSQDEPFWIAMTLNTLGFLEMVADRDDEAFGHLNEARDLAERFDNTWLAAWSRTHLGTLAVKQGRLDEARALLDEALALSMEAHSTNIVTLCLEAFARLSLVEGDAKRAGLLAGAADGLRRRGGLRAWPILRQTEAELVAQIRQALGTDRFDQVYADGTRLKQREAVAAVRDRRHASTQAS